MKNTLKKVFTLKGGGVQPQNLRERQVKKGNSGEREGGPDPPETTPPTHHHHQLYLPMCILHSY